MIYFLYHWGAVFMLDKCLRCGRKLKNPESVKHHYGPVCYSKLQKSKPVNRLFEVQLNTKEEESEEEDMGKINSKQKGKRGELELVNELKKYGYEAMRSQQYCGTEGDSDLKTDMEGVYIECKRAEKINLENAMEQAVSDCKDADKILVVMHRKNGKKWMVTLSLADFIKTRRTAYKK